MIVFMLWVGINDASTGTLSSYAYCILAIHFLQSQGLLPDLQVRTPLTMERTLV